MLRTVVFLGWMIVALVLLGTPVLAEITGTVFRDYDADGAQAMGEPGIADIFVNAYDGTGTAVGTSPQTTAADGSYTLGSLPVGALRLEFTLPTGGALDFLEEGAAGSTSVTFASDGATVDAGFNNPAQFCEGNPNLATPCYINGDPLAGGTSAAGDVLVSYDYNSTGDGTPTGGDPANHDALGSQLGSTWGLAFQRSTRTLFAAAFLKRHTGLGPLGEGGIYALDYSAGSPPTIANFLDVNNIGIITSQVGTGATPAARNADRGLNPTATSPSIGGDPDAFDAVGKVGLGDIDISDDESTLWLMNLDDQSLYSIVIDSDGNPATPPTAGDVGGPFVVPNDCATGAQRPFAVTYHDGDVFVGSVCEAALESYIYRFDGASYSQVLISGSATIDMSYAKGFVVYDAFWEVGANCEVNANWHVWTSTLPPSCNIAGDTFVWPTAVMSDIEFDSDGSLILGYFDRTAHQIGFVNTRPDGTFKEVSVSGGDILRACLVSGALVLEGTDSSCPSNAANGEGPNGGEFYLNDEVNGSNNHEETSFGGLALLYGSGEVVVSSMDPFGTGFTQGGINWFDNANGGARTGYTLYKGQNNTTGAFGKAIGLGDVELLCAPASIEIGNRVWCDAPTLLDTPDGIQDPPGAASVPDTNLAGVVVDLSCVPAGGGTPVTAMATTAADGTYLFGDGNVTGGIPPDATCTVSIDTTSAGNMAAMGTCTAPTLANIGDPTDVGQDLRDNDGTDADSNDVVETTVTVGGAGANNHAVDFGFRIPPIPIPILTPTKTDVIVIDGDMDGVLDGSDTLRYTVVIANAGDADATLTTYASGVDANTTLVVGSVTTSQGTVTTGNTGGDTSVAVDIGTLAMGGGSATITYDVVLNNPVPAGTTEINCQGTVSASNHSDVSTDDPDDPTPTDPTTTPIGSIPDVSATKLDVVQVDGDMDGNADAGDTLRYTVVVTNAGDMDGTTAMFSSSVDANTTLVVGTVTTSQGTVTTGNTGGDTSVAVDIGTLAGAGGSVTITFDVTVNAPIPAGVTQITCQGTVTGGNIPTTPTDDPDDPTTDDPTDTPLDLGSDFGDAPDSYTTTVSPSHRLDPVTGLYLGACIDSEDSGQPAVAGDPADGDDVNDLGAPNAILGTCAANDDEDGVAFTTMIVACSTSNGVTVTSSSPGFLDAWLDFDGDGTFAGSGEQIYASQAVAAGTNALTFTAPCTTESGMTYARFRLSKAGGLPFDGAALDGEVEDYQVTTKGFDLGDAPDSYGTMDPATAASHVVDPGSIVYLGACVDTEAAGQPATAGSPAIGDDTATGLSTLGTCTGNDDEDGVTFDTMIVACATDNEVTVTSVGTGALLDGWIDFDGDGAFTGTGEQIYTSQALTGSDTLMFAVPCTAAPGMTYARFRVSTAGGLGSAGPAVDGEVEDYQITAKGLDFGDAPDSYTTTVSPSHVVDPAVPLYMGVCVDTEIAGQPSAGADGDDLTMGNSTLGTCVANDDEDGVTFDTPVVACGMADVTVTASQAGGLLDAWLDFDGNGTFEASDQIFTSQALAAGGNTLSFAVPCDRPSNSTSYARFRVSTAGGLPFDGAAMDGEVEDYLVMTNGLDFGDAPDTYGTVDPTTGASHVVDPANPVYLGACVDTEAAGQPVTAGTPANGDDLGAGISDLGGCAGNDDEDGVVFATMIVACGTADLTITASQSGRLDAWIDFDGDGTFGAADQIFASQAIPGAVSTQTFNVPCDAHTQSVTYARFRVSTTGGLVPVGQASNGEVEDYSVTTKGLDLGDAPDTYATTIGAGGARHAVDPGSPLFLGACVDTEVDGQPVAAGIPADGDDTGAGLSDLGTCASPDDEDGVTFDTMIVACGTADVTVTASRAGRLDAWLDFDGDGAFTGTGEQIFASQMVAAGTNSLSFAVPCIAPPGMTYARFRVSTAGGLGSAGPAVDGEVEDYQITAKGLDFGDAPDSYTTTVSPSHVVDPAVPLYMGVCVDTEIAGQPSAGADGDDLTMGNSTLGTCVANDDEDGVTFDTPVVACGMADVTVTASQAGGLLDAWLDFDGNGTFEASDQIFTSQALAAGGNTLSFAVPCDRPSNSTSYARFRVSTAGGLPFDGAAMDGEVEDYLVMTNGLDFGDAPDTYGTVDPTTGASHVVDPANPVYLGACVDTEAAGQPVTAGTPANGDDLGAGISDLGGCAGNDDEDGVVFATMIVACGTADLTITASQSGRLDAWIDFDGDGTFGAADQIFASQAIPGAVSTQTFNVPCDAHTQSVTYARFRVSTTGGLVPVGQASNGEVEDYSVTTKGLDLGDAPDTYATTIGAGGARHAVDPGSPLFLGACVDTEVDGQPVAAGIPADGDDTGAGLSDLGTCASPDDEDGVTFDTMIVACGTADVTVTASRAGRLDAWLDFDGDGAFTGTGEQIFASQMVAAGTNSLSFAVPCIAPTQALTYTRFRISTAGGLGFGGVAMDGEVEDYEVGTEGLDFGDAPDVNGYPTLLVDDGARHVVLAADNPTLGVAVDTEPDGQPDTMHAGDDQNGTPDDEDGVDFGGVFVEGGAPVDVTLTTGATGGLVNAWIDWNADGDWDDAGEQIATDLAIAAGGSSVVTVAAPADAIRGASCARFRIDTVGGLTPMGLAMDGEIEDYPVAIGVEDPAIGVAKEVLDIVFLGDGEYAVDFQLMVDNAGNVPLSNVQVTASLATAFADAEGYSVSLLSSADFTVNPVFDGGADPLLLTGTDGLGIGESGVIVLQVVLMPGQNPGPYFCSSTATGDSPSDTPVSDDSQDGGDSDPDNNGDPTDNNEPTEVVVPLEPADIPTLGEWAMMLLSLLLAWAGFRAVGRR